MVSEKSSHRGRTESKLVEKNTNNCDKQRMEDRYFRIFREADTPVENEEHRLVFSGRDRCRRGHRFVLQRYALHEYSACRFFVHQIQSMSFLTEEAVNSRYASSTSYGSGSIHLAL